MDQIKYKTSKEMALIWGVETRDVSTGARKGIIPGVKKVDGHYLIPENAKNPFLDRPKIDNRMSIQEAAEAWGMSYTTIRKMCVGHWIDAIMVGKKWWISKEITKEQVEETRKIYCGKKRVACPYGYMPAKKAQEKWNISRQMVNFYLQKNRIHGAIQIDGRWYIPENAEHPSKTKVNDPEYIPLTDFIRENSYGSRIYAKAQDGKLEGAVKIKNRWCLPKDYAVVAQTKEDYITMAEAARKWGVSYKALRRRVLNGEIPDVKYINGFYYLPDRPELFGAQKNNG